MEWISRVFRSWWFRSVLVGGFSTCVDLSVLFTCAEVLELPHVPSVALGVASGGTVGFLLNKHFAFRDPDRRHTTQALRYAVLMGLELLVHSGLTTTLVHGLDVYYLYAKFTADFLVFTCVHLVMLRYAVFTKPVPMSAEKPPEPLTGQALS